MSWQVEVKQYQRRAGLRADGIVGPRTWESLDPFGQLPPRPSLRPLSTKEKVRMYGDPTGCWRKVEGPRFRPADKFRKRLAARSVSSIAPDPEHAKAFAGYDTVVFHEDALGRFLELWDDWRRLGLLGLVRSWNGSLAWRLVRGGTSISSHAFGIAFDINARWNPLGEPPAPRGVEGSVLDLVTVASLNGWFWGGYFTRSDAMHFELGTPA